jgi:hypothetical protein
MPRWRLIGVIAFSFFALLELADLALEFWPGYSGPGAAAELAGLSANEQIIRLLLLSMFAGGISAASLATVISLFRRGRTARSTSVVAGVLYIGYGLFQIASGLFWLPVNQAALIAIGALYLVFGPIAIWLGRQATHYRPEF